MLISPFAQVAGLAGIPASVVSAAVEAGKRVERRVQAAQATPAQGLLLQQIAALLHAKQPLQGCWHQAQQLLCS